MAEKARIEDSRPDEPTSSPKKVSNAAAEEATWMARIAAGDAGPALESLCSRYTSRLFGLGKRLLGDDGMAEELVQDTFVRVWRSAERFDPERGSARTFIYTLARRAAIDLQRRSASRPLATPDDVVEELRNPEATEDVYEKLLLGLDVRDALQSLSDKHRQALELCFDQDLTRRQVAERLDVPLGTVKTRVYHALRALRGELEERDLVD